MNTADEIALVTKDLLNKLGDWIKKRVFPWIPTAIMVIMIALMTTETITSIGEYNEAFTTGWPHVLISLFLPLVCWYAGATIGVAVGLDMAEKTNTND